MAEKTKKHFARKLFKKLFITFLALSLVGSIGIASLLYFLSQNLPDISNLDKPAYDLPTQIYDRNGELIDEYYIERRVLVPIKKVPETMIKALLAIEDSRFYDHIGIDPVRVLGAFVANLKSGKIVQGASTLTQQTAKMFLLSSEKKYVRKLKEALLSLKMENRFSKKRILELYLNKAYFGHGAWGIEAAAGSYFGKSVSNLNLHESALLAGLVQAPSFWNPVRSKKRAKKRRDLVLRMMAHHGFITNARKKIAQNEPITLVNDQKEVFSEADYYIEYVRKRLIKKYGANQLYRGGLKIYTSMDLQYQVKAQKALEQGLIDLDKRQGFRGVEKNILNDKKEIPEAILNKIIEKNRYFIGGTVKGIVSEIKKKHASVTFGKKKGVIFLDTMKWARPRDLKRELSYANRIRDLNDVLKKGDVVTVEILDYDQDRKEFIVTIKQTPLDNGAVFVMDPHTGHVLAMSGGLDFKKSEFNRAIQSKRQSGSAFKPIVYSSALDNSYTTASILESSPLVFKDLKRQFRWMPKDYSKTFTGKMTLRTALMKSKNIPTVRLSMSVGLKTIIEYARKLGITTHIPRNYSISLGTSSVTLQEIIQVYSVFANGGSLVKPIFITRIEDKNGKVLVENKPELKQVISKETAYLMTSILHDVVRRGTGRRLQALNRPSAGKTGTTNDFTDAWYIGYIPQMITGIYVGNDSPSKKLGQTETGSRTAAPIWLDFMKYASESLPIIPFKQPAGIEMVKINGATGLLACKPGRSQYFEYFKTGTAPTQCHREEQGTGNTLQNNQGSNHDLTQNHKSEGSNGTEGTGDLLN
ncbi:MAG: penicillin-binding protein 1A [bacterium]|jgi:penicillin-binding protein 1A